MVLNFERDLRQFSEAESFSTQGAQNYLEAWCRANGDMKLNFLSRPEWEEAMEETPLIQTGENVVITVPSDLKPWEVFGVVDLVDDVIDVDPEQKEKEKSKLKNTVSMFRQSALYLRHYIDLIEWSEDEQPAKELAQDLAREFYIFSRSLLRKRKVTRGYQNIPQIDLVGEGLENEEKVRELEQSKYEVESWLFGGNDFLLKHYERLEKKLGRQPTIGEVENERQKLLKTFFKALSRERVEQLDFKNIEEDDMDLADASWREYSVVFLGVPDEELSEKERLEKQELEKNFLQTEFWKKIGPNLLLQLSTTLRVKQLFSKPVSQMEQAIFRRGKNQLINSLKEAPRTEEPKKKDNAVIRLLKQGFGFDVEAERQLLVEKLQVDRLKRELQELKDNGAGSEVISQKELEIVDLIQDEVSQYDYELTSSMPAEIALRDQINCVGAVLISGMLFDAVGINYLVSLVKGHVTNLVSTHDGNIYFRDMRIAEHNCQVGSDQLDESSLEKIKSAFKTGEPPALHIAANKDWYKQISLNSGDPDPNIVVFQPEQGIYSSIMNNFAFVANGNNDYGFLDTDTLMEAIESYLDYVPNDSLMVSNLALIYIDKGFTETAALYLYRLEQMIPNSSDNMEVWASLFMKIDRVDLAIEACRCGLTRNSKNQKLWELLLEIYIENDEVENYLSTCFQARFNVDFAGFTQKAIDLLVEEERFVEVVKQDQFLLEQFPDDMNLWVRHLEHKVRAFVNDEVSYRQLCDWYWRAGNYEKVWEVVLLAGSHNAGEEWMKELLEDYRALCGGEGVDVESVLLIPGIGEESSGGGDETDVGQEDFDIPALV